MSVKQSRAETRGCAPWGPAARLLVIWLVLAATLVVPGHPALAQSEQVFSDGFESGGFAAWSEVIAQSEGTAAVQSADVKTGAYAARFSATGAGGSLAYARRSFSPVHPELTAAGDFKVVAEGLANSNVPIFSFFDGAGGRLVTFYRQNQDYNKLWLEYSGTYHQTSGYLPLETWARLELRVADNGAGGGVVEARLNGTVIYTTATASLGGAGVAAIQIGNHVPAQAFDIVVDDIAVQAPPAEEPPPADPDGPKLLIADLRNRRLLITDFDGRLIWKFDNPTGRDHVDSGPLGVRWMPGNQILATFGTGEVGVIDVASKTWVWKTSGYNGDWFQSPYDAEILPDGNLAAAMRFNEGGRISVYDRSTGKVVWKHLLSHAHSVKYRTAEQSYQTDFPTLLVGGWGSVREVAYRPNGGKNVTWNVRTEFTHDAIVVEDDRVLTTEGYYIQKIDRQGAPIWRHSTPEENRRIAVNPAGGYIYTVAEADKVEFRDTAGTILRQWSMLSDGSMLDYPYGIQVIDFAG